MENDKINTGENLEMNALGTKEGLEKIQDPIALEIPDDELIGVINKRVKDAENKWNTKFDLKERREKNKRALFGKTIKWKEDRKELKDYESRVNDNVLYEIEATLKPLAMSRLPDMLITPGSELPEAKETADNISTIVNDDIKKRKYRQVLGLAFKQMPVYFGAFVKAVWNPQLGDNGDYEFVNVPAERIIVDYFAKTSDVTGMSFISETCPTTVQEVVMRFPKAKEKFFAELKKQGLCVGEEPTWGEMASQINIRQVWFTWYKKSKENQAQEVHGEIVDPETQWERIEGLLFKYEDCLLDKGKNPNFDYEGVQKTFTYMEPGNRGTKREVGSQDMAKFLATDEIPPNLETEVVYRNYFSSPQKPYFLMVYDQWGEVPLDETSRIEQNLRNQELLDDREKIINDQLRKRPKDVFSKDSGLKPEDIQQLDMENPKQTLLIEGKLSDVYTQIAPDRPTPQEFESAAGLRDRMYSLAGSSAVRGELQTDVATSNQIARESDFTRADDLVEDTINAAAEWMSRWILQFIKLRYSEDHFREILGDKGQVSYLRLNRDMIDDGMEVIIKASGTDKLKAQRNAMQMAQIQMIDPYRFFKDMDLSDPAGRTEDLLNFQSNPALYLAKITQGLETTPQLVDGMLGQGAAQALGGQPPVSPQPGQVGGANMDPAGATPTDTGAVPIAPPIGVQASPSSL